MAFSWNWTDEMIDIIKSKWNGTDIKLFTFQLEFHTKLTDFPAGFSIWLNWNFCSDAFFYRECVDFKWNGPLCSNSYWE